MTGSKKKSKEKLFALCSLLFYLCSLNFALCSLNFPLPSYSASAISIGSVGVVAAFESAELLYLSIFSIRFLK